MQAFQPNPINLPGMEQSTVNQYGGGDFHIPKGIGKKFKWGIILFLGIVSIFIIVLAGNYSSSQRQPVGNQDIRPLGYVHTTNVQVTTPTASEIIDLPLFIQGTAVVDWFSDGIFPIEIRDGKNNVLASVYAIADIADPGSTVANFRASVDSFDMKPETSIGRVVLYKQKISKNPASDEVASIGVDFGGLLGLKAFDTKSESKTDSTTKSTTTTESIWTNTQTKSTTPTKTNTTNDPYQKYQKVIGGPYTCANGIDDDKDGTVDSEDPSCHTDGYPSNDRTYDGDLDEAKRAITEKDTNGNYPDQSGSNSSNNNTAPTYNTTNTIWTGNTKIRAEQ